MRGGMKIVNENQNNEYVPLRGDDSSKSRDIPTLKNNQIKTYTPLVALEPYS